MTDLQKENLRKMLWAFTIKAFDIVSLIGEIEDPVEQRETCDILLTHLVELEMIPVIKDIFKRESLINKFKKWLKNKKDKVIR